MRDYRGIKKCGGLKGILMGEVGPDETFSFIGKWLIGGQHRANRLETNEKVIVKPLVACFKFRENLGQHFDYLGFRHGQYSRHDAQGAFLPLGLEGTKQEARG